MQCPSSVSTPAHPRHQLREDHRAHLRLTSGLTDDTIDRLGFFSYDDREARALLGIGDETPGDYGGLVIPYPNVPGYAKVRPDKPRPAPGQDAQRHRASRNEHDYMAPPDGSDQPEIKVIKYESPRTGASHPYIPSDFCPAILDTSKRLYITEGEKKAALMCQEGLPTVGLQGVSNAHDAQHRREARDWGGDEWELHPEIARLIEPGREVCILFDSPDTLFNEAVIAALVRLARMLKKAGAVVLVSYVPWSTGGVKAGVDDYFVRHAKNSGAMQPLYIIEATARPVAPLQALEWLRTRKADVGLQKVDVFIELRRIAALARQWWRDDDGELKLWVADAKKKFRLTDDEVKEIDGSNRPRRPRRERDPAEPEPGSFAWLLKVLRDEHSRALICGGPGKLEQDARTYEIFFGRKPFGSDTDVSGIRENITKYMSSPGSPVECGKEQVFDALARVASENRFNPVQEYLRSLKWDGVPRILGVLENVMRVPEGSRQEIHQVMLRKWMISAVARALSPGCKVDTVLILQGTQGAAKSGFFAALAGDWFTDSQIDIGNKDALMMMGRFWIIEWSELEAMLKARNQTTVKGFVTTQRDSFRPPYGRTTVTVERSSVIVGTTNEDEFLADETGNRRYWIINGCNAPFDLERLKSERDQLWAEAVVAYEARQQWWLTPEEGRMLEMIQVEHERSDPWLPLVQDYVASKDVVTVREILNRLDIGSRDATRAEQMRVVACLKRLGFEQRGRDGTVKLYQRKDRAPAGPKPTDVTDLWNEGRYDEFFGRARASTDLPT